MDAAADSAQAPLRRRHAVHGAADRARGLRRQEAEWLARPNAEIAGTISDTEFFGESSRCYSCGLCFSCERCWMFCNPHGYTRLQEVAPGAYYALAFDQCEGCSKCIELCPCGFIAARLQASS